METLFPKRYGLGMPISFQADGSFKLDRGLNDKQAMLLSFVGKHGLKETCMLDLRELDMTKSKDGRSPDAAYSGCDLVSAYTAEQSCKIDSYASADLCGL